MPFNNGVVLGAISAEAFWSRMADSPRFTVGEITEASLGSGPALAADVTGALFERVAHMDFRWPSRLIVKDVGDGIIAVQLWATTPERLEAWVAEAARWWRASGSPTRQPPLLGRACWAGRYRPRRSDRPRRLEGTSVTIGYQLPVGSFSVEGQPGVIGFADAGGLATGLSYGFLDGTAITARGLVVGEATPPAATLAASRRLHGSGQTRRTSWTA